MKKILLLLISIISLLFISCQSTKQTEQDYSYDEQYDYSSDETEKIVNQIFSDDFIGDFDPIQIDQIMMLVKNGKEVKPKQIKNVYLIPRKNTIELSFHNVVNFVTIELNKSERDKLLDTCNLFLEQYESKTVPHVKISSKNAYFTSQCRTFHGVVSGTIECSNTDYYVTCEFIQKRPYLLIHFIPTRCDNNSEFTPTLSLYMSPTQVRTFIEQMNQDTLESYISDLVEKAYTY